MRGLVWCIAGLVVAAGCSVLTDLDGLSGGPGDDGRGGPDGGSPGDASATCNTADDSRNCGACGKTCGDAQYCLRGACAAGCPDRIVYVSPEGTDSNSGCSRDAPMKTLTAAIVKVRTLAAEGHEIHACRGTYSEKGLTLDYPVSMRGSYDCSTWSRGARFGYPGFEDASSTIEDPDVTVNGAALTVRGSTVGDGTTLDGFTINGASQGKVTSTGVTVRDGATLAIQDNRITGGVTTSGTYGSIGVLLDTGAAPTLKHNAIDGGRGTATSGGGGGSIGVLFGPNAGPAHVVENTVSGGAGSTIGSPSVGSEAIALWPSATTMVTGARAVERNIVRGGTGAAPSLWATVGIAIGSGAVEVADNQIEGGSGSCSGKPCWAAGVWVADTQRPRIARNRIYGGDVTSVDTSAALMLHGVFATVPVDILDNFIHGGNKGAGGGNGNAVLLYGGAGSVVAHNTLAVSDGTGWDLAINVSGGAKLVRIDNNLLLGWPKTATSNMGLHIGACDGTTVQSLRNNGFVTSGGLVEQVLVTTTTACDTLRTFKSVAALEDALTPSGVMASGNVEVTDTCPSDRSLCWATPACASRVGCMTSVLAAWDTASNGYRDVFQQGYTLASNAPCKITKGGLDLTAGADGIATDLFGTARTPPVSIGAQEVDGPCTP